LFNAIDQHDTDYDEAVERFRRRDAVRIMEMLGEIGIDGLAAKDDAALGKLKSIVADIHSNSRRSKNGDEMESGVSFAEDTAKEN
jgi:hypothetical protein